jgi:hypothetical protein
MRKIIFVAAMFFILALVPVPTVSATDAVVTSSVSLEAIQNLLHEQAEAANLLGIWIIMLLSGIAALLIVLIIAVIWS